jgi:hypothetical protein
MATKVKPLKRVPAAEGIAPLVRSSGYIAYIDILGFQKLLDDKKFEVKIAEIVDRLRSRIEFDGKNYPSLSYLAISDTIIIAAERDEGHVLVRKIGQLQNTLLKLGFATRGAVAFGPTLTYDGKGGRNIFGKTYLSAYHGEQNLAIYPRVVVLDTAISELKTDIEAATTRTLNTYLLTDTDGVRFVNQFSSDLIGQESRLKSNRDRAAQNCEQFSNAIDHGLSSEEPRIKMKWRWLNRQFEQQLQKFFDQ